MRAAFMRGRRYLAMHFLGIYLHGKGVFSGTARDRFPVKVAFLFHSGSSGKWAYSFGIQHSGNYTFSKNNVTRKD